MASYATNGEGDTYFAERYPSDEWDAAVDADKTKTLATATRLIDQLNFAGSKTVEGQSNEFPRNTQTVVPVAIKDACCEIAYALLDGHEVEYDHENLNVLVSRFGRVSTVTDGDYPIHLVHNIPSSTAWNGIRPYLLNTQTLKIERIS